MATFFYRAQKLNKNQKFKNMKIFFKQIFVKKVYFNRSIHKFSWRHCQNLLVIFWILLLANNKKKLRKNNKREFQYSTDLNIRNFWQNFNSDNQNFESQKKCFLDVLFWIVEDMYDPCSNLNWFRILKSIIQIWLKRGSRKLRKWNKTRKKCSWCDSHTFFG